MDFDKAAHVATCDLNEIRGKLGNEAADKALAIISILQIGAKPSVAESKAILAAAEMALDRMSTFATVTD